LNTYKTRLLKVIKDYKKYGAEPSKIQHWIVKIKKDKLDRKKIILSDTINTPVDNCQEITISLNSMGGKISIPKNITAKEAKIIKDIIDSLIA
jgi:hypothetical protein